jgi:hypothetical protein
LKVITFGSIQLNARHSSVGRGRDCRASAPGLSSRMTYTSGGLLL